MVELIVEKKREGMQVSSSADEKLSRGLSHTGAKFRAHEPGDAFAWWLLVPFCCSAEKWDLLAAAAPVADRAALDSAGNLGTLLTVNALILGFCTTLAFGTDSETIAAYAPLFAKGEYCCTDLDDRGLCRDEAMVATATLQITEELMQPALLCLSTAIVVCVLGAGMLYSLSAGYYRGASPEVLGHWANTFDVPMKALMALFCVVSPPPSACSSSRLSPPTNTPVPTQGAVGVHAGDVPRRCHPLPVLRQRVQPGHVRPIVLPILDLGTGVLDAAGLLADARASHGTN
eukprot:COSAG06_NODE_14433_length_1157_cov_0.871456_1_plen_287_part_10